jgi:hypothetical protein
MAEEAIPYVTGAIGAVIGSKAGTMGAQLGAYEGYEVGKQIAAEAHKFHDIYHSKDKDIPLNPNPIPPTTTPSNPDDPTKPKLPNPWDNLDYTPPPVNVTVYGGKGAGLSGRDREPPRKPRRHKGHKHYTERKKK